MDRFPGVRHEELRVTREIQWEIMGYRESWAAYTSEDEVVPSLDIFTFLREIGISSSEHYFERGTDFYQEVLDKRKRLGYLH